MITKRFQVQVVRAPGENPLPTDWREVVSTHTFFAVNVDNAALACALALGCVDWDYAEFPWEEYERDGYMNDECGTWLFVSEVP